MATGAVMFFFNISLISGPLCLKCQYFIEYYILDMIKFNFYQTLLNGRALDLLPT